MSEKAWGGRFSEQPEDWVDEFNASIHLTKHLLSKIYKVALHMRQCWQTKKLLLLMKANKLLKA